MPSVLALDRIAAGRSPEVFGRYELLGRLGTGGMAEVFVARCGELEGIRTLVAIKRILPHLAEDERLVALFRREAQITVRLRHRAIARVFEVGRIDAAWYLAMELVAGESLSRIFRAERVAQVRPEPALVAHVGAEIASALHHAHGLCEGETPLGVVHRDVSPQNVLLAFDGSVKLIDFGVARWAQLSDATRTGTIRGKLAYAAPEQIHARAVDGRADLFSLAAVLYEWLAGRALFARDSDAATVKAVLSSAIPPPVPGIQRLSAVLMRALERDPERRYQDGESFAEALLAAVDGRLARPDRALAAHLERLFPDHKSRWAAITSGVAEPADGAAGASGGGTAPATRASIGVSPSSLTRAGRRPLRRVLGRVAIVIAALLLGGTAAVALVSGREDRASPPPPAGPARIGTAEARAAAPGPLPAATPPTGPSPAVAASPPASAAPASPSRRRISDRSAPKPPAVTAPAPPRRVLDELEPSPYAGRRRR